MFHQKLREARLKAGLILAEAARRSGLSVACWTRNERGISDPSVLVAARLTSGVGVTLDALLGRQHGPAGLSGGSFGERLRDARERAGLTRDDLACEAHTDYGSVRKWESGERVPTLSAAVLMADRLEVPLWELAGIGAGGA